MKTFRANLEKADKVINLINTAREESKKETIYVMSNGKYLEIVHKDYVEEYKNDGCWVAQIYEYGHICEI